MSLLSLNPSLKPGAKKLPKGRESSVIQQYTRLCLTDILTFAQKEGFSLQGLIKSPLTGPKGNIEFLVWLGVDEKGK